MITVKNRLTRTSERIRNGQDKPVQRPQYRAEKEK